MFIIFNEEKTINENWLYIFFLLIFNVLYFDFTYFFKKKKKTVNNIIRFYLGEKKKRKRNVYENRTAGTYYIEKLLKIFSNNYIKIVSHDISWLIITLKYKKKKKTEENIKYNYRNELSCPTFYTKERNKHGRVWQTLTNAHNLLF